MAPKNPKNPKNPNDKARKLFEEYGYAWGLIQSNPSLKDLFKKFVDAGSTWTPTKIQAQLRLTDWYKNNSLAKRNYEILRTGDPAQFESILNSYVASVKRQALALGVSLAPDQLRSYAEQLMSGGIRQDQIDEIFANTYIDYNNADLMGRAGSVQTGLQNLSRQYGNILSDSQIANYTKQILTNGMLESDVIDTVRRSAAATYTNFSDRIMAGESVEDIAKPYRDMIQELLEVADVSMQDNLMLDALTGKNEQGGMKYSSLSEFKRAIKGDPRWQFTDNARSEYFSLGRKILTDWGLVG